MNNIKRSELVSRLSVCKHTILLLLSKLDKIEKDKQMPANDKLLQIKIIREELNKVGTEIDTIEKEFTLVSKQKFN